MIGAKKLSVAVPKTGELLTEITVGRKPLPGNTRYSYCPYCYKRVRASNPTANYKEVLKPLWVVTKKMLFREDEATGKVGYSREYQCPICKSADGSNRVITGDDYVKVYSEPYTAPTAKTIPLTADALMGAGFNGFAAEFAPEQELQF